MCASISYFGGVGCMGPSPYSASKDRCRNCRVCTSFGRQVPSDQRTEPATVIGSGVRDDVAKVPTRPPRDFPAAPSVLLLCALTARKAGYTRWTSGTKWNSCCVGLQQYFSARHSSAVGGNNSRGPIYNLEVYSEPSLFDLLATPSSVQFC